MPAIFAVGGGIRRMSDKFILHDDVWHAPGVRDVTPMLAEAASSLSD